MLGYPAEGISPHIMMEEINMSKKLMLIAAAIFGFNVCAMAQAPAAEKPADAKMEKMDKKDDKKAMKKGKKAKKGKKMMEEKKADAAAPAAPAAPATK